MIPKVVQTFRNTIHLQYVSINCLISISQFDWLIEFNIKADVWLLLLQDYFC